VGGSKTNSGLSSRDSFSSIAGGGLTKELRNLQLVIPATSQHAVAARMRTILHLARPRSALTRLHICRRMVEGVPDRNLTTWELA
jgi:hypothetical protein